MPRWFAILLIYAAIIGVLVGIGMAVMPPLMEQAAELWSNLPEKIDQGQRFLIRMGILRDRITLGEALQQAPKSAAPPTWRPTSSATVRNVVGGLLGIVTILLLTFYMLVESGEIFVGFRAPVPGEVSGTGVGDQSDGDSEGERVARRAAAAVGSHRRVVCRSASWAMGVPYFYVLALISAVGEMIPMVGPILAAIPAILVAATVSPGLAIGVGDLLHRPATG